MKRIYLLLLISISVSITFAQVNFEKPQEPKTSHWSFTLEGGMNQFDGDMNQNYNDVVPNANFKFSGGASLEYTITPIWGLGIEYYHLPLSASNNAKNYFTSNLNHFNAYFAINFLNLLSSRIDTRWGLWATVGGGLATYHSKYYSTSDDVPDELADGLAIIVPVGVLVEYNFSKSLALGTKIQYRSHNKDNLEGNENYNFAGVTNDFVSLGTVSLRWKFNAKNRNHVRNLNTTTYAPEEAMIPARQAKAKADSLQLKVDSLRQEVEVVKPRLTLIENKLNILSAAPKPEPVKKVEVIEAEVWADDDNDGVPNGRDREPNTGKGKPVDYWGVTIHGVNVDGYGTVYFDFDKVDIDAVSDKVIDNVARRMINDPLLNLEVRGFADNVGNAEYNQKLSQRRADVVKDVLINKYRISASRVIANGKGKIITSLGANRMNRRCNFYFSE